MGTFLFHSFVPIKTLNVANGNEEKVERFNKGVVFMISLS